LYGGALEMRAFEFAVSVTRPVEDNPVKQMSERVFQTDVEQQWCHHHTFKVKVMNDCQHLQGLFRGSLMRTMETISQVPSGQPRGSARTC